MTRANYARARIGIPLPSPELASALAMGAAAASHIAERPDLLVEKRRLDLAFYERFDARGREALHRASTDEVMKRFRIEEIRAGLLQDVSRKMQVLSPAVERLIESKQQIDYRMLVQPRGAPGLDEG